MIQRKRAYEEPSHNDGFRILVDRLWPRGLSKADAKIDLWLKEVAPSTELRQWFNHDPEKWPEFKTRYRNELADNPAFSDLKQALSEHKTVTLMFGAHDTEHNQAVVLQELLSEEA